MGSICALFALSLFRLVVGAAVERQPAHDFRGCITYSITVDASEPGQRATLEAQYGTTVVRCFGKQGYRVEYAGKSGTLWYRSTENREYQLERGATEPSVVDGSKTFLKVSKSTVEPTSESILGHRLSLVRLEFADGSEERLWFTTDLPMDPAPYAEYRFGGADVYFASARSAFLNTSGAQLADMFVGTWPSR
jgi:hypothetical protein